MIKLFLEIIKNRKMLFDLAKSDFKKRFAGSFFGVVWMFVQPTATVLVYTLIFQVGFKSVPPIPNIPYVVWLITGLVPWFYFQDSIIQNTNCLYEYNYLVKKVVFNVELLPVIKLISCMFAHICFIVIMLIVLIIANVPLTINYLYIIYYTMMLSILILGISYLTSSINVFFKDMSQIVNILLQFGIWMCPIMFDENLFASRAGFVLRILKLNPFYYIVKGYRYSLIGEEFNSFYKLTIYYFVITLIIFVFGYRLFTKLKKHFADVL